MRTTPPPTAPTRAVAVAAGLLLTASLLPAAAQAQNDDPWSLLQRVRESLVQAGPSEADFVQTYVPAGFSAGEKESGKIAIALPECLRWDYAEPYPKIFLLCGDTAHYWNPEDGTGRRFEVDREEEPGLDLVLLGVEDLRRRYRVQSGDGSGDGGAPQDEDRVVLRLVPTRDSTHPSATSLSAATLVVDRRSLRLTGLSYEDDEGNLTRFEIGAYHPLEDRGVFSPPEGIQWREGKGDEAAP